MKRRSKAGGEPIKGLRRKAAKQTRRNAPKAPARSNSFSTGEETEVARLTRELSEALERQAATSEVLQIISGSPGDLQPVFEAMLVNAVRICDATFGNIYRWDGKAFSLVATHNTPLAYAEARRRSPVRPNPNNIFGLMVATKAVAHVPDAAEERERGNPEYVTAVELGGVRTCLAAPMLKEHELIGSISLFRQEVRPFTDKQIALITNFAAQAVIAIENARLLNELRQRTTDLTERTADLTEALEQQTATSEVLQVISSSPGDLQPVFQAMLEKAIRICDAGFGNIYRWDGEVVRVVATHKTTAAFAEARSRLPDYRPGPKTSFGRMIATKAVVHVADAAAEPGYVEQHDPAAAAAVELGGVRTALYVPMVKGRELIGAFILSRQEVRPFTDKQIALVTNFAAQAVIAIENARLLNELRQSLERQTATSEVLQVISSSPGDLEPVFATMLDKAVGICDAQFGTLYLREADRLRLISTHNVPPAFAEAQGKGPFRPAPHGMLDAVMKTGRAVHLADLAEAQSYLERDPRMVEAVEVGGIRTVVGVPLLKGGELIGLIGIYRQEVRPFTDKQIELVTNFAAQAVIAIENARLLNELRQSLEQQTATAEVLQVISSSPGDLQPVFAAMLENAARICDANFGNIFRWDGDALWLVAIHNTPAAFIEHRSRVPFRPNQGNPIGDMLKANAAIHVADLARDERYIQKRDPEVVAAVELGGIRTFVAVPMLKDEKLIGAVILYRQEVRPFSDKQIELVKNFAAQAVIAIENARLLSELRQSLEERTATSEVLQVISSSSGDLQPVFASILENATRICEANFGVLVLYENAAFHVAANHKAPPAFVEMRQRQPTIRASGALARVVAAKQLVHISDCLEDVSYRQGDADFVRFVDLCRVRSLILAPMLKEAELIGVIGIYRTEVRPFADKQIALVQNFANQAVIAIENARLLNELRGALERQTATSEVLQVISGSPGDLEPVFAAMLENAVRICDAKFGNIYRAEGDGLRIVATRNTPPVFAETRRSTPFFSPGPKNPVRRMMTTKAVVQVTDVGATEAYAEREPVVVDSVELGGTRTLVIVPMLKDKELIGAFTLARQEVRPFTDKQIAVLTNFAAQAVIAIENARLLNELRQRTNDLTEALEEQTATSEVLQIISSSPGELEPVFAAMLGSATRICEAKLGNLFLREGETFRAVAWQGLPTYYENWRREPLIIKTNEPHIPLARLVETKQRVHIADLKQEAAYKAGFVPLVALVDKGGARTLLIVPMLKEHTLVGAIAIYRHEVRPFTAKQIALVENFAAQAVIAIENARLLGELRERTEEVLKLNQQLEQRVADQVGEIERMGRLRRFLPPQVADLIVASGSEKQLESHRREITALFCDLRGFTGFTEIADAEDVMALLRGYHAAIGEIIIKYNGTLERYAGDGVMVVFNDPVPVENPALQAVLMALEVRDAIGTLTETWRRLGHDIGFGIGIAHGFATLGTIGFEGRFDYAAIGTVSNVASRLCDEAKPGQILISPRVLTKVENAVSVEPVGEFALKGIRRPLAAYNVVAAID